MSTRPSDLPGPGNAAKDYRKACTVCEKKRDVLVRCQIDPSETWHFVCPGSCWRGVSGGEIDGLGHPFYRYGGMWKNKHEAVSAKKPKRKSQKSKRKSQKQEEIAKSDRDDDLPPHTAGTPVWNEDGHRYTKNDQVVFDSRVYDCRKSHVSDAGKIPTKTYQLWKEHKNDAA